MRIYLKNLQFIAADFFKSTYDLLLPTAGLDKFRSRCRSCAVTRAKPLKRPIFRVRTFCLVKNKKPLDLQVFIRISKTIKNLQ